MTTVMYIVMYVYYIPFNRYVQIDVHLEVRLNKRIITFCYE